MAVYASFYLSGTQQAVYQTGTFYFLLHMIIIKITNTQICHYFFLDGCIQLNHEIHRIDCIRKLNLTDLLIQTNLVCYNLQYHSQTSYKQSAPHS